ncbi:alkaline phosphatase D family protein [Sphingomonas jeddahensis]|uniref:Alkaline phosphatase D n=1 Tax=Sphingomonas jeddahensis TaxID=1915074 RepID=A0A1V2ETC7_9SPHN|nr:alkaline phosphatase D family protein [Sphingomonas jeddahensis]ONF95735.1 Alkaline phosphatase D precursor [Sphingomonas jeddahensis]
MTSLPLARRHFLVAGLVGAPALLVSGRALAATDPFALGVASGEPLPDGFVIWTRIAAEPLAEDGSGGCRTPVPVRWEVAEDDRFARIVARGDATAHPAMAGAVHVDVHGLRADRPYWYRFVAAGVNSPTGRAWTAPSLGSDPAALRFTAATCSHWEWGYFSAYRHMAAEEDSKLTLFLGDYIYESTATGERAKQVVRSYAMPEAMTLSDYRRRYALHRTDRDLQSLHAAAACVAIWDDHEAQNDYSGIWPQDVTVSPAAFAARRLAAYRAFCENMPLRLSQVMRPDGSFRINRRLHWGRLAQFDAVDGRQFRSRQACIDGDQASRRGRIAPADCPDFTDPSRTFLGFEQERWLYDGWASSNARWNLLVQNLLVAPMRFGTGDAAKLWTDTWNGFGAARSRMIEAMAGTRLANPVTLAGDYHSWWMTDLHQDPDKPASAPVATEIAVTSITSTPPPGEGIKAAMRDNPHIRYFEQEERGYLSVNLTRAALNARLMAISDRRSARATVRMLREAVVESGKSGWA